MELYFTFSGIVHETAVNLRDHLIRHAETIEPALDPGDDPALIDVYHSELLHAFICKTFMESAPEHVLFLNFGVIARIYKNGPLIHANATAWYRSSLIRLFY